MYDDLAWVESNYGCVAEYNGNKNGFEIIG